MGYPICVVEIYGRDGFWELTGEGEGHGVAPSGDLISVRTDKRLGVEAPAGVFDLRLVAARDAQGKTWQDRLRPQDMVVIQMMNYQGRTGAHGAGEMHTPMIGFVDTVTAMTDLNPQGIPQRQIQVRGRDAGKLFVNGLVTYFTFAGAALLGLGDFAPLEYFNVPPDLLIQRLLEEVYQKYLQIAVPGPGGTTLAFWDMLDYNLRTFSGEIPGGLDSQFIQGEGSFWSFFTKVASPPFHELFVDTRRSRDVRSLEGLMTPAGSNKMLGRDASAPFLFLRPTPFQYLKSDGKVSVWKDWEALPLHTVGEDDLYGEPVSDALSRSDQEQYNVYLALGKYYILGQQMQILTTPPIIDEVKFRRYGYKPLMPNTWLSKIDLEEGPWPTFFHAMTWKLASWHCLNDEFLSGTKTFKLLPHVHIGERLLDASGVEEDRQFYIESVSHQFIQNERATTTLGLTRGLPQRGDRSYANYHTMLTGAELMVPQDTYTARLKLRKLIHLGQRAPQ